MRAIGIFVRGEASKGSQSHNQEDTDNAATMLDADAGWTPLYLSTIAGVCVVPVANAAAAAMHHA